MDNQEDNDNKYSIYGEDFSKKEVEEEIMEQQDKLLKNLKNLGILNHK